MADANNNRSAHIFPIVLKGAAVELGNSDDGDLPLDTSFVSFNITAGGSNNFYLRDGNIAGQLMVLYCENADNDNSHVARIVIDSALGVADALDEFRLQQPDESVTLMWNGEAWMPLQINCTFTS